MVKICIVSFILSLPKSFPYLLPKGGEGGDKAEGGPVPVLPGGHGQEQEQDDPRQVHTHHHRPRRHLPRAGRGGGSWPTGSFQNYSGPFQNLQVPSMIS